MTLAMIYNKCPSSAIIVTLWSFLTYNRCEVVMSSLWVLRKYQEVSYLHAKKISIIIITVTKIVPSPTGELSFNKKRFPPGLYKFSDTAEEQESSSWSNRIHGNMLHLEQEESCVIDPCQRQWLLMLQCQWLILNDPTRSLWHYNYDTLF